MTQEEKWQKNYDEVMRFVKMIIDYNNYERFNK